MLTPGLSEEEKRRIFEFYLAQLKDESFGRGKTIRMLEAILKYLWENRQFPKKRLRSEVAKFLKREFRDPGAFRDAGDIQPKDLNMLVKRRGGDLERIVSEVTNRLMPDPRAEYPGVMTLIRPADGREPLQLQFASKPATSAVPTPQDLDDFDQFWAPYRNPRVETKIIIGQPLFLYKNGADYRNIESFSEPGITRPAYDPTIPYRYVRFWDMQSALTLHDTLLGVRQINYHQTHTKVIMPAGVTIESSRQQYEPLNELRCQALREFNIVALGYPRDNGVLKNYQNRGGLHFTVLPEDDYAERNDAKPRVVKLIDKEVIQDELGVSQLKRCVLTRRKHTTGGNFVTLIAANSARAVKSLTAQLCNRHSANTLIGEIRDLLDLDADKPLPPEFQCIFAIDFQDQEQVVHAEDCKIVEAPKGPAPKARVQGGQRGASASKVQPAPAACA
jgi:hypothetical protein